MQKLLSYLTKSTNNSKKNYSFSELPANYIFSLTNPKWTGRNYTKFAEEAFRKNVIAHRAITLISQSAAAISWQIYKKNRKNTDRLEHHPLARLLARPNPNYAGAEFFENIFSYRLIAGNAYIHALKNKGGLPLELSILRPDRIEILIDDNGKEIAYRHKTCPEKYQDFPINQINGESSILHIRYFNPLDDYYGLSPVEAASYSIDQHNQAAIWNQALLQNGARPSGAIIIRSPENTSLSNEQFERLKGQIEDCFMGSKNASRPMILEGGMEWREMSMNSKDMDFIEAKNSAAREIALAFGVPPQLIGIPGDNTYSNMQEARLALWEETILPILNNLRDSLNNWLVPMYKETGLYIDFNREEISALSIRREALWKRIENASFLTIDEKRALLGFGPINDN